ncbi:hypothetical protein D3C79_195170 [compost metagenome]
MPRRRNTMKYISSGAFHLKNAERSFFPQLIIAAAILSLLPETRRRTNARLNAAYFSATLRQAGGNFAVQ